MKLLTCLFVFILLFSGAAFSQMEEEINVAGMRLLDYSPDSLKEDILQTRSAILVSVPQKSEQSSERGDWKSFATEAHDYFKKIGIDPVIYIYLDDVLAGPDAARMYSGYLKEREIKYLIILSKSLYKIGSKIDTTHVVLITAFNGQPSFITNGQSAWKDQDRNMDRIMRNIYRIVVKQEFRRTNHLIIDQPEFLGGINLITVRRNESFPSDIRIDKLAVPKFTDYELPGKIPGGSINHKIANEIEESNKLNDRLNLRLEQQLMIYPWKYELVDYHSGEEKLFNEGFQFVLLNLRSSGYSIHEMLGYETKTGETDYITIKKKADGTITFRSIPVEAPVYKFYIKHLARQEIYLGETWDADESWEEALQNFLNNLVDKIKP